MPPKALTPERVPRKVPIRPSSHMPVAISVFAACEACTVLQPGPITANNISTPCIPYQYKSSWLGSMVQGAKQEAPNTFPHFLPSLTAAMAAVYLNALLVKKGVSY